MKLIQLDLTLFDEKAISWKFNFREFGVDKDLQNSDSIALLKRQDIDFSKNKQARICSFHFAKLFVASELSMALTWLNQNPTLVFDMKQIMRIHRVNGGHDRVAEFECRVMSLSS
ncbi:unnamed protein product [Fraxinus pennsylvanica]|uniref:Uncharacterized protein n=1 Tax=Fraxinus pennsylvanica TaxID=56036 RepID=A0AAD2EFQ2_9LAMI|nr:unnamed protein product [Fraxinus pennsylvanica]